VIALVSCSGPKLSHAAPARSLYASPLFRRANAYAARHFERWFILSGKYGLVEPEAIIAPYDVDVTHFTAAQRRRSPSASSPVPSSRSPASATGSRWRRTSSCARTRRTA
jgi:hypothetical protein